MFSPREKKQTNNNDEVILNFKRRTRFVLSLIFLSFFVLGYHIYEEDDDWLSTDCSSCCCISAERSLFLAARFCHLSKTRLLLLKPRGTPTTVVWSKWQNGTSEIARLMLTINSSVMTLKTRNIFEQVICYFRFQLYHNHIDFRRGGEFEKRVMTWLISCEVWQKGCRNT